MAETENRMWLDAGIIRVHIAPAGFVPLELVYGTEVLGRPVPKPVKDDKNAISAEYPLPAGLLGDGLHILFIRREGEATPLAHLSILIGEMATDTLVGEVALLRAELDMVKDIIRTKLRAPTPRGR